MAAEESEKTKQTQAREKLLAELTRAGYEVSAQTVKFHAAVAAYVGLNTTDHKALDILGRQGAVTAGKLAHLTGLTTGAITGVVDRLEAAGFVKRGTDPGDRRRVIVQPIDDAIKERIGPFTEELTEAAAGVLTQYSDDELAVILDYLNRLSPVLRTEALRLWAEALGKE